VRAWLKRFNAQGLPGLEDAARSGRPATYTAEEVGAVVAAALTNPQSLGLPAVAVLYALQAALQPASFVVLGIIAAAGLAVYGLVYFIFRATAGERELFQGFVIKAVALARSL
jgi:hypothetical protein